MAPLRPNGHQPASPEPSSSAIPEPVRPGPVLSTGGRDRARRGARGRGGDSWSAWVGPTLSRGRVGGHGWVCRHVSSRNGHRGRARGSCVCCSSAGAGASTGAGVQYRPRRSAGTWGNARGGPLQDAAHSGKKKKRRKKEDGGEALLAEQMEALVRALLSSSGGCEPGGYRNVPPGPQAGVIEALRSMEWSKRAPVASLTVGDLLVGLMQRAGGAGAGGQNEYGGQGDEARGEGGRGAGRRAHLPGQAAGGRVGVRQGKGKKGLNGSMTRGPVRPQVHTKEVVGEEGAGAGEGAAEGEEDEEDSEEEGAEEGEGGEGDWHSAQVQPGRGAVRFQAPRGGTAHEGRARGVPRGPGPGLGGLAPEGFQEAGKKGGGGHMSVFQGCYLWTTKGERGVAGH